MLQAISNMVFKREYQNFLKEEYTKELFKVWDGNKRMIDFNINNTAVIIPIHKGKYLVPLDKINLEKDFYFGYSDIGQGPSFEENSKRMDEIRENKEQYFKDRNTQTIKSTINTLSDIITGKSNIKIYCFKKFCSKECGSNNIYYIGGFSDYILNELAEQHIEDGIELNMNEIKLILKGYQMLLKYTEKRIDSYLKKYGTKKIHISSYWIDR